MKTATPASLLLLLLGLLSVRGDALEYVIQVQTNAMVTDATGPLPQGEIVQVLQERVQRLGGGEVVSEGPDRVRVRLFNLRDEDQLLARRSLERMGFLEFRLVHPESEAQLASGLTPAGFEVLQETHHSPDNPKTVVPLLVKKRAERGLNGSYITRAAVVRGNLGEPEISFELNPAGAAILAEVTRENIGRRLAIVLDGELRSAPMIRSEIPGGAGVISGHFELMEAVELANALENPIGASLKILEERAVDPAVEASYRRRTGLKTLVLLTGALVTVGLVLAGIAYILYRFLRTKPAPVPRATPPTPPQSG